MALTRELLKGLGIEETKHQAIIDAHTETVEALKAERDKYKADADKLPEVQKELKEAQKAAEKSGDAAKIQKAFDDYKAEVQAKDTKAKKETALRKVAKDAGMTDNGIEKIVKFTDFDSFDLDDAGAVKDTKGMIKTLREEWPEHISKTTTKGADNPKPPIGNGGDGTDYSDIRAMTAKWHAAKYGEMPKTPAQSAGNGAAGGEN